MFAEIDYPVEGRGAEERHEAAMVRHVAAPDVHEIQEPSKVSKGVVKYIRGPEYGCYCIVQSLLYDTEMGRRAKRKCRKE